MLLGCPFFIQEDKSFEEELRHQSGDDLLISYVIILEFVFQKWAFCAIMFSKDFSSACLKYSSHLDV